MTNRDILIVEDNPADIRLIQEALRTLDPPVVVHAATDAEEALAFLRRADRFAGAPTPRLVFLDFNLPKSGSRDLLRQLKADSQLCLIPIAILTSSASEKDIADGLALHANCYLTKAADLDSFFHIIRWSAYFWLDIATPPPVLPEPLDPLNFNVGL